MVEDKTESNNFASPSQFGCLNNYEQFENSVDFNKEIVTSRHQINQLPLKARLIFSTQKSVQKNLLEIKHVITTLDIIQYW